MTYAGFLSIFLLPPLVILSLLLRRRLFNRHYWLATALLLLAALLAMALWDHTAVALGIWSWTQQRIWGLRLWLIPLEEYLFAFLETLLLTMLVYTLDLWRHARLSTCCKRNV